MSSCAVCARLQCHAHLGRELREALVEAGSPAWTPAEDLSWRAWIERFGDYARALIAAIDELLVEMVAGSESGGTPKKGQRRALRRRFRDQTVSRRAR